MEDFTVACVASDKSYKQYSDKIVSSCGVNSATQLKSQKACIDKIKEVIKAPSKKHPPIQKFYSLKLLNKCVLKKNPELNLYVEQKLTQRLSILAEFNNDPNEKSAQALLTRGKHIFGPDEKDTQNSANFLIILLDCLEKWALTFQFEESELDDTKSNKSKMSTTVQSGDKFYKVYTKLLEKGVKFPSTFKQDQRNKSPISARKSISSRQPQNMEFDSISNNTDFRSKSPNRVSRSKTSKEQSERSKSPFAPQSVSSMTSRSLVPDDNQSTSSSLTPEKKTIINNLKKKMQKVKEASKNAQKFNEKMSQPGADAVMADAVELITLRDLFTESKNNCEDSINQLMSDEVQPHISNSEKLLEKMFGYQEVLNKALSLMNKQIEQQQQIEQQVLSASKADSKKDTKKPDIPKGFDDDNDVIKPRKVEKPKKQDSSSSKNPIEQAKNSIDEKSKDKAVDEVNQIMQDNKTNIDQTTVVDSIQQQNNQTDFQDFDFKNKDLSQEDQPASARQVMQTNNAVSNPYDFNDFSQNKEMFQTHVQKDGQNAFGLAGKDDQWFNATSQQQPPQTDFNFNFDKPVDNFDFSSDPSAPKSQKQPMAEEEEKVPEAKKNFDENLDDQDGLRIADQKDDQLSNNDIEEDGPKKVLTFADSPSKKETFGRLSQINQSKPITSENKVDITFAEEVFQKQEATADNSKPPANDFFQFDNSAPKNEVSQVSKPPADDFAFEFGTTDQSLQEKEAQDPSQLFNFGEGKREKSTGRFEKPDSKSDFGIDLSNMQKSPTDNKLNETGQFGFNADTFRKQDDPEEENTQEKSPTTSPQIKKLPETSKFGDSKKLEDDPSVSENTFENLQTQQSQIKDTVRIDQPGGKDDDDDISSGISGKSPSNKKQLTENAIENDKFEEEFVPQAKSSLDESRLQKNEQDLEISRQIERLKRRLKEEEVTKRWWQMSDSQESTASLFANNITPQQLQPMNEIKNQLEDMQEYQQEILKLKGENKNLKDEQESKKDENIKYEQNIKDLTEEVTKVKQQMADLKTHHSLEVEAKDQELKQTNLELQQEKEQKDKRINEKIQEKEQELEQKDMKIEELLDKVTKQMQSYDDLEQKYKVEMQEQQAIISCLKAEIEMMEMPKQEIAPQADIKKEEVAIDFNQLLPNKQSSSQEKLDPDNQSPTKQINVKPLFADDPETSQQSELQSAAKELPELASPETNKKSDINFVFSPELPPKSGQKEDSLMQNLNFGQLLQEKTEPETLKQESPKPTTDFNFDLQKPEPQQQNEGISNKKEDFSFEGFGLPSNDNHSKVLEDKKPEELKLNESRSTPRKIPNKPNMFADKNSSRNSIKSIDKSLSQVSQEKPKPVEEFNIKPIQAEIKPEKAVKQSDADSFAMNQLQNLMGEPSKPKEEQKEKLEESDQDKTIEEILINGRTFNQEEKKDVSSIPLQMPQDQVKKPPQISIPEDKAEKERKSNPFEIPTPKQMLGQAKEEAPQQSQQKMMQALQQDLLRQKLSSFHINSLLQGSKCVIYEDVNVKIGCIRKVTFSNGNLKAEIKIFLRNHNQTKMNINNIDIKLECTNEGQSSDVIKVIKSSQALPLQSPPSEPLVQNQTLDMDIEIQWPPAFQTGFRNFTFDNFKMVLQYELENKRRSGFLPINLPFNILNLLQPHSTLNAVQFRDLWQQVSVHSNVLPQRVQEQRSFQLDLQKAQNMAKLKQIISLNNTCFAIVPQVETQPNWVCFASVVTDPSQQSQPTIILVKIMLTKDGKECSAQMMACRDTHTVSLQVFDTILQMISKQ